MPTQHRSFTLLTLGVLFLSACAGGDGNPTGPAVPPALSQVQIDGVTYTATTAHDTSSFGDILVSVAGKNATADSIAILFGDCPINRLLAYRTPDRAGTPAWDSFSLNETCTRKLNKATIPPGGSWEFHWHWASADILAGTGSGGRFYFTAVLKLSVNADFPEGRQDVALIAGDLDLR